MCGNCYWWKTLFLLISCRSRWLVHERRSCLCVRARMRRECACSDENPRPFIPANHKLSLNHSGLLKQHFQRADTHLRTVLHQFIKSEVAGRDSDRRQTVGFRSRNVKRSIADDANRSIRARDGARLFRRMRNHVCSKSEAVAESAEGEPLADAQHFQRETTNRFQIACA